MTHPLLDLIQFNTDHPPRDFGQGQWRARATHEHKALHAIVNVGTISASLIAPR